MKKIITVILCLIMLTGALPMGIIGSANTQNPFKDVPETSWYSSSVLYCYEKGYMSGISSDKFGPDISLTRAQIVVILAAMSGDDLASYADKNSFTDCPAKWYHNAVEWAFDNGITGGTAVGKFSPNAKLTRQDLAVMMYKYATLSDLDLTADADLAKYSDESAISSYAKTAVSWAVTQGLISGTSATTVSPKGTATRAMTAVIIRNLDKVEPAGPATFTINGNDISLYKIVYSSDEIYLKNSHNKIAAEVMQKYIKTKFGCELEVVQDDTEPGQYEILIGTTNRESSDFVVHRDTSKPVGYDCEVIGDKLVIAGTIDTEEDYYGTEYGVYMFLEKYCEFDFITDSIILWSNKSVSLNTGFRYADSFGFESRCVFWQNGWQNVYTNDSIMEISGSVHNQMKWIDGSGPNDATPCLSKEENIQKMIEGAKKKVNSSTRAIGISQNDSSSYCTCADCRAAYSQYKSRAATLIIMLNRVAAELKKINPDIQIMTLAYEWSLQPPYGLEVDPSIVVYFCPITGCINHPYNDTTCSTNKNFTTYLTQWGKICSKVYVWDYSTNFTYGLTPFPNLHNMLTNANFFYANNVRGAFNNAVTDNSGEFGELRAYLITQLYRHPDMTMDEYNTYMKKFLKAWYGKGYTYIYDYICLAEELAKPNHTGYNGSPDSIIEYSVWRANSEKINELWSKAYDLAETEAERKHITQSNISVKYMNQCANYETMVENGNAVSQNSYYIANDELYGLITTYKVRFRESDGTIIYDRTKSPSDWKVVSE